jgi:hypothetical protein
MYVLFQNTEQTATKWGCSPRVKLNSLTNHI